MAIATAYINPAGMGLLLDELDQVPRVRILLGAEPEPEPERALLTGSPDRPNDSTRRSTATRRGSPPSGTSRDSPSRRRRPPRGWSSGYGRPTTRASDVSRCAGTSTDSCTARLSSSNTRLLPAVLAGSQQLTYTGWPVGQPRAESRLPVRQPGYVALVRDWFERLWEHRTRTPWTTCTPPVGAPHPWVVFLRMLLELYRDHPLRRRDPAHRTSPHDVPGRRGRPHGATARSARWSARRRRGGPGQDVHGR